MGRLPHAGGRQRVTLAPPSGAAASVRRTGLLARPGGRDDRRRPAGPSRGGAARVTCGRDAHFARRESRRQVL